MNRNMVVAEWSRAREALRAAETLTWERCYADAKSRASMIASQPNTMLKPLSPNKTPEASVVEARSFLTEYGVTC